MKKDNDFFDDIIFLESIDSTNDYLKKNNFKNKTIAYTFNQTKGKGRDQKKWVDIKNKNLALSFLMEPETIFNNNIWYIAATSLALIDVIKKKRISDYWIKWPNDIYIKKSKIAGILAETIWRSNKIKKIIIGIGINVNCTSGDLSALANAATSFYMQSGVVFDMNDFFNVYKDRLSEWLSILLYKKNGISAIKKNWLKHSKITNKDVIWQNHGMKIYGKIIKIEDNGTIIFRTKQKDEKIISGEFVLKK